MTLGIAIMCDVRASRQLPDRAAFGRRLDATLRRVNEDADRLLASFERQAGLDEFTGIARPGRAGRTLVELWEALHPAEVRFAVVQGELDVIPDPPEPGGLPPATAVDGPALHRASQLLDRLREGPAMVAIRVASGGRDDRLLTALGDVLYGQLLSWTERQMEIVRRYRAAGSQPAVADELGVAQSTVSRSLSSVEHRRIEPAIETFEAELDAVSGAAARRNGSAGHGAAEPTGRPREGST